jgi:ferric-dicitrate binding protein FerR (iron transport regulator)
MVQTPEHLIVRFLSNEATQEEQTKLFEWVTASADNQRVFYNRITAWEKPYRHEGEFNADHAWNLLNVKIDLENQKPVTVLKPHFTFLKIAAALLVLVCAAFLSWFLSR